MVSSHRICHDAGFTHPQTVRMSVSVIIRQCCHVFHMRRGAYVLCVCMCTYVCMCVYASVVFKNGKGSFTQCVLVLMHNE